MPMPTKLTDEVLLAIKDLAEKKINVTRISSELGISRATVNSGLKKLGIEPIKRFSPNTVIAYKKFKQICEEALLKGSQIKLNQTLKELGLHADSAQKILRENPNYRQVIRSKKQAILQDKTLSLETAQSRLPDQSDKAIGFKKGKYKIQTKDGFIYYKTSAKLHQGDPRGKSGSVKNLDYVKKFLKEHKYTYHSDYIDTKKPFQAVHDKCGNIRTNRLNNFKEQNCPSCSNNGMSKAESELRDWIEKLGLKTEKYRFKGKTKGKEIDIYIPSLKLGIEYCGLYWHNEMSPQPRNKNYHFEKMKQCNEQGVRLITIFEDEWLERNKQVKNYLKSVFGINTKRVYARKCSVKEVEKQVAKAFLEDNHIQGKTIFKKAFGLYNKDELLGLVTSNTHHRQGHGDKNVLNRLVFADGVQVVGGSSKLLKHLIRYSKEQGYGSLISWSDNRWSEGNVYSKIGFNLIQELGPDYSYYVGDSKRNSKQSNKKKLLLKKGAIGDMSMTERELALTLGYYRIWDCGKKTWEIKLDNLQDY